MTDAVQLPKTVIFTTDGDHISESDASAFWARLPEKVAIALVKAAPKVADPWEHIISAWVRDSDDTPGEWAAMVRCDVNDDGTDCFEWSACDEWGTAPTLAEAKAAADAQWRANGGLLRDEVSP